MRLSVATGAVLTAVALSSSTLGAQSAQCTSAQNVTLRDACQKGTDIFSMLAPQVNGAVAGGGALLGSARAVNGISVGLRVNAVDGRLPDLGSLRYSSTGVVRSAIATTRTPVPAPAVDVGLSVLPGILVGVQRVLALDLLVNVAYIPNRDLEDFSVRTTNGSLKLGYGARLGLLSDRLFMPAVAVSYFRRSLPTSTFSGSLPSGTGGSNDSLSLGELSLRSDALRLAISKRLGVLEVGGGVGQDRYRSFAQLRARVTPPVGTAASDVFVLTQSVARNTAYGSLALNILKLRLAAEAGSTFGGDSISTFNSFTDGKVNAQRLFGSVGLRVSF